MLRKGFHGWKAEEDFDFNGAQRLEISTSKHSSGALVSSAHVMLHEGDVKSFVMCKDFSFSIIINRGPSSRCTEKNVREQQRAAVARLPEVRELAKAWYAKESRVDAP